LFYDSLVLLSWINSIINIINNILENNNEIEKNIQKEITYIAKTIIEQNYFQFDRKYYKQTDGLAMGTPTSSVLAETYLQHMEHTNIPRSNKTTNNCIL
jgi:hypothetical protein